MTATRSDPEARLRWRGWNLIERRLDRFGGEPSTATRPA